MRYAITIMPLDGESKETMAHTVEVTDRIPPERKVRTTAIALHSTLHRMQEQLTDDNVRRLIGLPLEGAGEQ